MWKKKDDVYIMKLFVLWRNHKYGKYELLCCNRPEAKSLGRRSIEDRAKEILERNKGRDKSEDAAEIVSVAFMFVTL